MSIKLSRLLPLVNVALAIILLQWGRHSRPPTTLDTIWVPTPTLLCYGINAPAFRISSILDQVLSSFQNDFFQKIASSVDILFVLIVGVFWYLIGKRIDDSRSVHAPAQAVQRRKIAWKLLIMAYGINLLIVICLHNVLFTNPRNGSGGDNNFLGDLIFQGLWFAWSLILIVIPGRDLLRAMHGRTRPATG